MRTATRSTLVDPDALRAYARELLRSLGAPAGDAERVADSLVRSNLAGHDSHGVILLPYYAELVAAGRIDLAARPEIVSDRGSVVVVDGRHAFGQIVGLYAAELARERGRRHGIACVLARNANHVGRLGEYTVALAEAGLAAIMLVNFQGGEPHLAPFGGLDRRLTNNPISVAAPGGVDPVFVDMALSVVAEGKVWLARARGEPLPAGWIVDRHGNPSTDPADFEAGALMPLGGLESGHKAYGLIVLVDVLAGVLSGGGAPRPGAGNFSNAFLLVALDVEPLATADDYAAQLDTLRSYVKSARRRPGVEEILLPGEPEAKSTRRRRREGIPIEAATLEALAKLAARTGVKARIG